MEGLLKIDYKVRDEVIDGMSGRFVCNLVGLVYGKVVGRYLERFVDLKLIL